MSSRILLLAFVFGALAAFVTQSATAHEGTHEGKVVKTDHGKLTMTRKGEEKQHTLDVAASATITLDDKPAKLGDLKVGYQVKVTNDAKHVVTKIEAHSKEK